MYAVIGWENSASDDGHFFVGKIKKKKAKANEKKKKIGIDIMVSRKKSWITNGNISKRR